MTNLYSLLSNEAGNLDFLTFGGVDIEITLKTYSSHYQKYTDWIAAGYAGEMQYLIKRQITREDPRKLFPEAKSIFCVAEKYSASEIAPNISQHKPYPKYARYLRGEDYHVRIKKKLESLMHNVTQSWNENHSTPLKWKICIDTSALLERSWAMFAGLGWIGKNTMLIHPKSGSFFLLAAVLINEPLDLSPKPLPNYCGNCNRCITSCPTQAFVDKNILDARKCISYLTLEKKSSNGDCKNNSGTWVAGCDICQEVCPFNKKAIASSAIQNDDPVLIQDWEKLINETESEYNYRVKYSALNHVKYSHFKKNIRLANKFTESTTNYL